MSYSQMVLLCSEESLDLAQIEQRLSADIPSADLYRSSIPRGGEFLELTWNDWAIAVGYEKGDVVAEESREIAEAYAEFRPDRSAIAHCRQRIVVNSAPDPEMEHFNDFVLVLESLEKIPGAVLFDPQNESFD